MFKKMLIIAVMVFFTAPSVVFAGEGATIVFDSGTIVYLRNGYSQLITAFKDASGSESEQEVIELNIEGTAFAIDLREVVLICRDQCSALEVKYRSGQSK